RTAGRPAIPSGPAVPSGAVGYHPPGPAGQRRAGTGTLVARVRADGGTALGEAETAMAMVDAAQLKEPAAGYRPVAMWCWDADVTEEEVRRQVKAMAAGGVGGVQIAARTGRASPYLSERWFELVALAIDEARDHSLDVWL